MRKEVSSQINKITEVISDSPRHMEVLRTVRRFGLPDWMIGAGFVRNAIWDRLHGFELFTTLADIDVIYFDSMHTSTSHERAIENKLIKALSGLPWSVRNQARMHVQNNDRAYTSSEDAVGHWLETPTCIAIRLENDDNLNVVAPHGLEDLLCLDVRPTPSGLRKPDTYDQRILMKDWKRLWLKLQIYQMKTPCSP